MRFTSQRFSHIGNRGSFLSMNSKFRRVWPLACRGGRSFPRIRKRTKLFTKRSNPFALYSRFMDDTLGRDTEKTGLSEMKVLMLFVAERIYRLARLLSLIIRVCGIWNNRCITFLAQFLPL